MNLVFVAAGLLLLLTGGELLVKGSVALAGRFGVSKLIIGLTIVAMATSAPELVVSLEAALSGVPGVALGIVVGSNIANVLLVLGIAAAIAPIGRLAGVVFLIAYAAYLTARFHGMSGVTAGETGPLAGPG